MTDTELLEMLRRGELLEALEGFRGLYHSALIRRAETLIARYEVPLTPDEVVSDVWTRFVMHDGRRQITSVKGILLSMVRTEVYQTWRRSRLTNSSLPDVADPVSIENEVINRVDAERLEKEIAISFILTSNQIRALYLRHKYGYSPEIIAVILNSTPGSVLATISQAKNRVRSFILNPDYRPIQFSRLDELCYNLHQSEITINSLCAGLLEKRDSELPIDVIREKAAQLLKEVGFYS